MADDSAYGATVAETEEGMSHQTGAVVHDSSADEVVQGRTMGRWAKLCLIGTGVIGTVAYVGRAVNGAVWSSGAADLVSSPDTGNKKEVYLEDDIFSGRVKVDGYDKDYLWIKGKSDKADHFSCNDWDDDRIYPTGTCSSGDATQCGYLTNFSAFNRLCNSSCSGNTTWGVPCAWEVISKLGVACDTIADGESGEHVFESTFPDDSKNLYHGYYKEYLANEDKGKDFTPYEFNATMDSGTWDDCNSHAFCYSSVSDEGELNEYSRAVVAKYDTLYAAQVFFNNIQYWCEQRKTIDMGLEPDTDRCVSEDQDGCSGYITLSSKVKEDVKKIKKDMANAPDP